MSHPCNRPRSALMFYAPLPAIIALFAIGCSGESSLETPPSGGADQSGASARVAGEICSPDSSCAEGFVCLGLRCAARGERAGSLAAACGGGDTCDEGLECRAGTCVDFDAMLGQWASATVLFDELVGPPSSLEAASLQTAPTSWTPTSQNGSIWTDAGLPWSPPARVDLTAPSSEGDSYFPPPINQEVIGAVVPTVLATIKTYQEAQERGWDARLEQHQMSATYLMHAAIHNETGLWWNRRRSGPTPQEICEQGLTFDEGIEALRGGTLLQTHYNEFADDVPYWDWKDHCTEIPWNEGLVAEAAAYAIEEVKMLVEPAYDARTFGRVYGRIGQREKVEKSLAPSITLDSPDFMTDAHLLAIKRELAARRPVALGVFTTLHFLGAYGGFAGRNDDRPIDVYDASENLDNYSSQFSRGISGVCPRKFQAASGVTYVSRNASRIGKATCRSELSHERTCSSGSAPRAFHRAPLRLNRTATTHLHVASTLPEPIGRPRARAPT